MKKFIFIFSAIMFTVSTMMVITYANLEEDPIDYSITTTTTTNETPTTTSDSTTTTTTVAASVESGSLNSESTTNKTTTKSSSTTTKNTTTTKVTTTTKATTTTTTTTTVSFDSLSLSENHSSLATTNSTGVIVTISANNELKSKSGWTLSENKKSLTKIYYTNTDESVSVTDIYNQTKSVSLNISNIYNSTTSVGTTLSFVNLSNITKNGNTYSGTVPEGTNYLIIELKPSTNLSSSFITNNAIKVNYKSMSITRWDGNKPVVQVSIAISPSSSQKNIDISANWGNGYTDTFNYIANVTFK